MESSVWWQDRGRRGAEVVNTWVAKGEGQLAADSLVWRAGKGEGVLMAEWGAVQIVGDGENGT